MSRLIESLGYEPLTLENFDIERGTVDVNTVRRGTDVPELGYHIATVSAAFEREPYALLFAAAPDLLAAAETVLAGLNARIGIASKKGLPVPVFDGIADLHDAINKAKGETQ